MIKKNMASRNTLLLKHAYYLHTVHAVMMIKPMTIVYYTSSRHFICCSVNSPVQGRIVFLKNGSTDSVVL